MPRLLLVLGSRGAPVDGLLRSLAPVGEVVVLTSRDVLGERVDRLSPGVTGIVARDRRAMVSTALSHHLVRSVDGVVPVTEDTIEIAAALSHRLGVAGPADQVDAGPAGQAASARRAPGCRRAGSAYARVRTPADARGCRDPVPLPAVLKPCRGSGGRWPAGSSRGWTSPGSWRRRSHCAPAREGRSTRTPRSSWSPYWSARLGRPRVWRPTSASRLRPPPAASTTSASLTGSPWRRRCWRPG